MITLCELKEVIDNPQFKEYIFVTEEKPLFNPLYHEGDVEFVLHLLRSENVEEITDGVLCLFRPVDFLYAENWVVECRCVPEGSKSRLRHAIRRIQNDSRLWFSITASERLKCDGCIKI